MLEVVGVVEYEGEIVGEVAEDEGDEEENVEKELVGIIGNS